MSELQQSLQNFLSLVRTTKELDILLRKIDEMIAAIYQLDQKSFAQIFAGELRSEISSSLQEQLAAKQISFSQPENLKEFLTALKGLLQNMSLLTLTIAFPPSDEDISIIATKVKELYGITTVLEINIQESILGGAMIIHKGKYLDYSLKTKIDTIFTTRSKEVLQLIQSKS